MVILEVLGLSLGLSRRQQGWEVRLADEALVAYLTERQNPAGDWLGVFPSTVLGVCCLHALGVPVEDGRIGRGLAALSRWKVLETRGLMCCPSPARSGTRPARYECCW